MFSGIKSKLYFVIGAIFLGFIAFIKILTFQKQQLKQDIQNLKAKSIKDVEDSKTEIVNEIIEEELKKVVLSEEETQKISDEINNSIKKGDGYEGSFKSEYTAVSI